MYVNPPSDTWEPSTWADLGITQFKPCVLKAQIIQTSLMSAESAREYFNGQRDDLINIVNEEGYATVSLFEPLNIFTELAEPFEVHHCVFDGGFFHLKRTIEGTEYQGISNCPWFAFNPEDVVLILYNKNHRENTIPLEDRLIIVGHSQFEDDNDLTKLITLPPRTGFSGDYYTNYETTVAPIEQVNCFLGIRDHYLIKFVVPYDDYEMSDDDHGPCQPLSWDNQSHRYSMDYPHGTLLYTYLFIDAHAGSSSRIDWAVYWYGPRQFHTYKQSLAYKGFSDEVILTIRDNLLDWPFITTTVDNCIWARMFDYGSSYDVVIGEKVLDENGFITGVTLTSEEVERVENSSFFYAWPIAIKSDAAGQLWSTDWRREVPGTNKYLYTLNIYINNVLSSTYIKTEEYKYLWGKYLPNDGSWITYLYMNVDAGIFVYIVHEYFVDATRNNTIYLKWGSTVVELSSAMGYIESGATTNEYSCSILPAKVSHIDYLCLDYRPTPTHHGIKHFCDLTCNDRGDITFIAVPAASQLIGTSPTFSYATRTNYTIIKGKLLPSAIDLETFDYLDLDTL